MPQCYRNQKGNALVYAIILITLFIMMSFGVGALIVQGAMNVSSLEYAARGFYAAEGGVELALLSLKKHFPGFEKQKTDIALDEGAIDYTIVARTTRVPQEGEDFLFPNETVTLALYNDMGGDEGVRIQDLNIGQQYFILTTALPYSVVGTSCLEWTVFGFRTIGTKTVTESMGGCLQSPILDSRTITGIFKDIDGIYHNTYSLETFLLTHTQNYLHLSYYNPPVEDQQETVFYHLNFYGGAFSDKDFIITANGRYKNYQQVEKVVVPQGELFPVFNFAIFNPS